jgi:fused signal recognition particle receptor
LDGSAKAGFVLAVQERTGIPIKLVGQGESIGDLTGFTPHVFVRNLVENARSYAELSHKHRTATGG